MDQPDENYQYGIVIVDDNPVVLRELERVVRKMIEERGEVDQVRVKTFARVWEAEGVLKSWLQQGIPAFGIIDLVPADFMDSIPSDAPRLSWPSAPPSQPVDVPAVARYLIHNFIKPYQDDLQLRPILYSFVRPFLREELKDYVVPFDNLLIETKLNDLIIDKSKVEGRRGAWRDDLPLLTSRLQAEIDAARRETILAKGGS